MNIKNVLDDDIAPKVLITAVEVKHPRFLSGDEKAEPLRPDSSKKPIRFDVWRACLVASAEK